MTLTRQRKWLAIVALNMLGLLFWNFDYVDVFISRVSPVDQKNRAEHAKELLGKKYNGSKAHVAENIRDLNLAIYQVVRARLPKAYQNQAAAVSDTIIREAEAHDFDPVFVLAIVSTESSFNPLARGPVGEIGLMQVRPETAAWMAKREGLHWDGPQTLENPVENIKYGVAYISHLRDSFDGYASKYVSAYNMGASKVRKLYRMEVLPKEYAFRVMKNYKDLYTQLVINGSSTFVAGN
jgi:soluble lytic murein transglycosylase